MRERRTFGQWFADARPRLVPAGCAVALFAVTVICLLAVVAPNLRVLLGSANTGATANSATATAAATTYNQDYTLILPTAPATAIKLPRTPNLPNTAHHRMGKGTSASPATRAV
jgi:hypothetical protein